MIAYLGNPQIKTDILAQLEAHRAADQLVKGQYWSGGKGCAIACTLHSSNHEEYETRFGIPQTLAHLEDRIFEGLPPAAAMEWPIRFMTAVNVGADLSMVWPLFAVWMLREEVLPHAGNRKDVADAITGVISLYERWTTGAPPTAAEFGDATYAAAYAAGRAAGRAADAADAAVRAADAAFWVRIADKLIELISAASAPHQLENDAKSMPAS